LNFNLDDLANYGINEFADHSEDELKALKGTIVPTFVPAVEPIIPIEFFLFPLPYPWWHFFPFPIRFGVDWRKSQNILTPIKNQGYSCLSCWAHAAIEA